MSGVVARETRCARRPVAPERPRPRLVAVPAPPTPRRRPPFAACVVTLLGLSLVLLLWLSTLSAQASFRAHELSAEAGRLAVQTELLQTSLQRAQDPFLLARRARALGMVPAATPRWLRVPWAQPPDDGTTSRDVPEMSG